MLRYLVVAGVGAALFYFLNPENGAHRREAATKELSSVLGDQMGDVPRHTACTAEELAERTARLEISWVVSEDLIPTEENFSHRAHIYDSQFHQ